MNIKELIEAEKKGKLLFGTKEVLKKIKSKKLNKSASIFVCRDAREETLKKLEEKGVEFEVIKNKSIVSKELGINFESEVFLIN